VLLGPEVSFMQPPNGSPAPAAATSFFQHVQPILPLILVPALIFALWRFFRDTWKELDEDAQKHRGEMLAQGKTDYRPLVAMVMCALILTLQEYFGGRLFFDLSIRPLLLKWEVSHPHTKFHLYKYDELYGFGWWAFARVSGYVAPFFVWRLFFREDRVLELRAKGFFHHAWIYGLFLAIVLPAMLLVSTQPDFGTYYPFYKLCTRSWFDLLVWEAMYFAQFFALEMFFRGFWLGALRRSFGSGAIFAMAVPYCMIHYGKPFLEANGAIIAGIALGSLSMRTKSIYQGFFVHITVAALMDWLALFHRHALPKVFWPPP
jgi:membrane protease YdiL (CAAX protease family)